VSFGNQRDQSEPDHVLLPLDRLLDVVDDPGKDLLEIGEIVARH
jgi:hypothetical protein